MGKNEQKNLKKCTPSLEEKDARLSSLALDLMLIM